MQGFFSERVTGLELEKRLEFNPMIRKCKKGKIDTLLLFRTSIQLRILSFEKSETSDLQNDGCENSNVVNPE